MVVWMRRNTQLLISAGAGMFVLNSPDCTGGITFANNQKRKKNTTHLPLAMPAADSCSEVGHRRPLAEAFASAVAFIHGSGLTVHCVTYSRFPGC